MYTMGHSLPELLLTLRTTLVKVHTLCLHKATVALLVVLAAYFLMSSPCIYTERETRQ